MRVILKKEIKNLGKKGEVREVADGYARNFLLPYGLAVIATNGAVRSMEESKVNRETKKLETRNKKIGDLTLVVKAKVNEEGHLFAGVSASMISREIEKQKGLKIKAKDIKIGEKIKGVGEYIVFVKVGEDEIKTKIVVKGE